MSRNRNTSRSEVEAFWRSHLDGWAASNLNQREYCEAHGLPLKRFGNWRAKLKDEMPRPARRLLWRRGGGVSPSASTGTREIPIDPVGYVPNGRSGRSVARRSFSEADKRRIVEEACREGTSVYGVGNKYGIASSVLFRWRKAFGMDEPCRIVPVTISDAPDGIPDCLANLPVMSEPDTPTKDLPKEPSPGRVIVERSTPGIEVELIGGRRVRFERDTDPETIRRLVVALEGELR